MKKSFLIVGLFFSLGLFCFVIKAESFVKPKRRTKKISASKVKEKIADEYAEIQQEIASLLKVCGHLLEFVVDDVKDILEDNKGSFFAKSNIGSLKKFHEKLYTFKENLKDYNSNFKEQTGILKSKSV